MLLLDLEGGANDPGGGVRDEDVELPRLLDQRGRFFRVTEVPPEEQRLGAELLELLARLLCRAVVPQVADRYASGSELGEAQGDPLA